MNLIPRHILAAAYHAGVKVSYHAATDTHQIEGHRADRWYALRDKSEPKPLVYMSGGVTHVHGDDYSPTAYTHH